MNGGDRGNATVHMYARGKLKSAIAVSGKISANASILHSFSRSGSYRRVRSAPRSHRAMNMSH